MSAHAARLALIGCALALGCAWSSSGGAPESRAPDIVGLVTQVDRGPAGPAMLFIERNPSDAAIIGEGSPKSNVALDARTRVVRLYPNGEYADARRDELVLGRVVRVWYAGSSQSRARAPAVAETIVIQLPANP